MSRCVLHVGMHKTGTSSIQQSLNGFANDSIVYADINGQPNHSQALFQLLEFSPRSLSPVLNGTASASMPRGSRATIVTALLESIERAKGRTYLLSGEGIALLPEKTLGRLIEFLGAWFEEFTVVASVRPPAGYMASAFQEPVKQGSTDHLDLSRQYRSYRRTFAKFDKVFGRGNVRLWKFDPAAFPSGCAVRHFCQQLGIALPVERTVRVNESLSREALGLLFTYRRLGRKIGALSMTGPQNQKLVRLLMKIGNTRFRFSPEVMRPILEKNRADIEWMEDRLDQSLQEELGEHQPGDVRDEADLLCPDPKAVTQLRELLRDAALVGVNGVTPEQVALLVHRLRGGDAPKVRNMEAGVEFKGTITHRTPVMHGDGQMRVAELIAQIRKTNPRVLDEIPDDKAAALIRNVFRQINESLSATTEGIVRIPGLGSFRLRKVEKEVDGKKTVRTHIVFIKPSPSE